MKKFFFICLIAILGFGCTKADKNRPPVFVVERYQDLPVCDSNYEGAKAYVDAESKNYICVSGTWNINQ